MFGHSRIQMVLRYAHPTEEHQFAALKKLEAFRATGSISRGECGKLRPIEIGSNSVEYGFEDILGRRKERAFAYRSGLAEKKGDAYASLDKLFALSPESAVLQAYNLIERKYTELNGIKHSYKGRPLMLFQDSDFVHLLDDLAIEGYISSHTAHKSKFLREMRNRAAHAAHFQNDLSSPEWKEALSLAKDILAGLDKASESDVIPKRKARRNVSYESTNDSSDISPETLLRKCAESVRRQPHHAILI